MPIFEVPYFCNAWRGVNQEHLRAVLQQGVREARERGAARDEDDVHAGVGDVESLVPAGSIANSTPTSTL